MPLQWRNQFCRVWRKVPESAARSVRRTISSRINCHRAKRAGDNAPEALHAETVTGCDVTYTVDVIKETPAII